MNPDDDVMLRLQYYKETGQADHARDYEKYLRETGQWKNPIDKVALAKRQAALPEEDVSGPGYIERLATNVLNAGQGIPGVEAVEAGAGMLGSKLTSHPMNYEESLKTLREATDQMGWKSKAAGRMLGSVATLPFLPANPAAAGALLGGADQALSATPQSLLSRGAKTAAGAVTGAITGKVADVAITGARTALAPGAAANLLERQAARAKSAKSLYDAALAEGKGKAATPEIQAYLAEPDIQEIVAGLKETREFRNMAPESPEFLDAIYKNFSDQLATIKKGLVSVSPNKPNIGRFRAKNVAAAQQQGLLAMDTSMPTYRRAVADYAQHTAAEDALKRGYDAARSGMVNDIPTSRNLTRTTPEAFEKWAETAGPDQTRASVEGILGATKAAVKKAPLTKGRKALQNAPSLLRSVPGDWGSLAARIGLLGPQALY